MTAPVMDENRASALCILCTGGCFDRLSMTSVESHLSDLCRSVANPIRRSVASVFYSGVIERAPCSSLASDDRQGELNSDSM